VFMIYLDNASSTQVAAEVVEAMQNVSYGNASAIHRLGREAKDAIENARAVIASRINANPEEIVFTSGGTEGNNIAIKGVGGHVVTTAAEHLSVLNVCKEFDCTIVPVDNEGFIDHDSIVKAIKPETKLVSVIHGNNEIGTINDIAKIGEVCGEKGVLFHTDACQSFLKEEIDVKKMNIDLMTINSHKVHGPKGVGALFVRKDVKLKPLLVGGEQEFGLRAGTENVVGIVGFGKAVEIWSGNDKVVEMCDSFVSSLLEVKDSKLNGSNVRRLCNNVNISFKGVEGEVLVKHLDNEGIMASMGSACTAHRIEPSHVLEAIGLPQEWAIGSVRFGLSRYNTEEDLKNTVEVVKKIVENLRKI